MSAIVFGLGGESMTTFDATVHGETVRSDYQHPYTAPVAGNVLLNHLTGDAPGVVTGSLRSDVRIGTDNM